MVLMFEQGITKTLFLEACQQKNRERVAKFCQGLSFQMDIQGSEFAIRASVETQSPFRGERLTLKMYLESWHT